VCVFFFQAEDGIRDGHVTGVQTCALPILWMPMSQMGGIQQGIPSTLAEMPHQTVADYEDILARLETLPKHVEQHIELLGEGLRRSEERRVGKECRSGWVWKQEKQKKGDKR